MYSPLQFPLNVEESERGRSSVLLSPEMPVDKCWLYQNFSEGGDNVSCWTVGECKLQAENTVFEIACCIQTVVCVLQGFSTDT